MLASLPGSRRRKQGGTALVQPLWLALLLLVSVPGSSNAQPELPKDEALGPVLASNPALVASLARISRGSPTWRSAIDSVRQTGRMVLVATLQELQSGQHRDAFDTTELAEVVPVLNRANEIPLVIVGVDLRLLQRIHDERRSVPRDVDADLDRIIVHEVYGHAIPYLLAGNLSGRCADPGSGERASDACSIRRENAVRAELGLGRRLDGGVSSLTLAWSRGF
jgi:hypothetical protein